MPSVRPASRFLSSVCPISTCMCMNVLATEGPCPGLTSWGLGSGFSALDEPVKGWEGAGIVGTLLQGLGSRLCLLPHVDAQVLGPFGQQWPTWNPFPRGCAASSARESDRPGRFWVGLWAHLLSSLSWVHAALLWLGLRVTRFSNNSKQIIERKCLPRTSWDRLTLQMSC